MLPLVTEDKERQDFPVEIIVLRVAKTDSELDKTKMHVSML